jgi:DNA-binding SARP family transcriptional activator
VVDGRRPATGAEDDGAPLRFGVLGPVTVWRGDKEIRVGSAKHRSLLAVLLSRVNERVSRDCIIDSLWGGSAPSSAVNLVQKYVGDLRRAFGGAAQLLSVAGGYQLAVADDDLDSARFGVDVETGRSLWAAGDPERAEACLRQALALWRGPAFDGVELDLAAAERSRLTETRLTVQEDLAELALTRGDHDGAAAELAGLVREHPLRERLREHQMVALYRQGRRAEALEVFAEVRALLGDELGVDPGLALQRCFERILRGDPALDSAAADNGTPSGWAVGARLPIRQLPLDIADFVGRAAELATLADTLAARVEPESGSGAPRVVVVTGSPGVGKSSLVVHAAHAAAAAFPDGQFYLDLAGTAAEPAEPAHLLAEMLHALSVTDQVMPDGPAERAALYRSLVAGRRVLVVLDDAGRAEQVVPLLPASATCAVLVTSRNLLGGLPGTRRIDLDVLDPLEARQLFTSVVGAHRTDAESVEAAAVLACCANLPLAIRIAAARLAGRPAWPLRVLRERLEDESRRLSELRLGELGVRASVELSLKLLPGDAVQALCLVGLLGPHSVPAWVVGPLLDRPHADDVVDDLVDASLLRLISTDAAGQPRYRLHDLIRAHAVERAEQIPLERRRAALTRLVGAWLDLVERANDRLPASLFQPAPGAAVRWPLPQRSVESLVEDPTGWFDAERDTLIAVIGLAGQWDLTDAAWELAAGCVAYDDARCAYQAWVESHRLALGAVRAAGEARGEAVLLRGIAQVSIYRDELEEAVELLEPAQRLSHEAGDGAGEALSLAMLASVSRVRGRYAEALGLVQRALALADADGARHLQVQLRGAVARILMAQGRLDEASDWFEQALRQAEAFGDRHREAVLLRELGPLHARRGAPQRALECLTDALRTFEASADEQCAANTLLEIGRIHVAAFEYPQAQFVLERAAELFHRHGDQADEAKCWQLLGDVSRRSGSAAAAQAHFERALRLWRSVGDAQRVTEAASVLAVVRN